VEKGGGGMEKRDIRASIKPYSRRRYDKIKKRFEPIFSGLIFRISFKDYNVHGGFKQ
jgi:hypothetical protein